MSGKPHRWLNEIIAWAKGETVLYRVCYDDGTWSMWFTVPAEHRFVDYPNYEYRKADVPAPHKWQREKEAFLSGVKVEYFNKAHPSGWQPVDEWLAGSQADLWDREWLDFRVAPDQMSLAVRMFTDMLGNLGMSRKGKPNVKLTFGEGELKGVQLL